MLLDYYYASGFVAIAFQSKAEVRWRREPPVTYFGPALDPPLDGSGRKTTTLVRDHEHFMPTKFRSNPLRGSVVKADYVFPYIYTCISAPLLFQVNKYIENFIKIHKAFKSFI